ncbi:MAG: GYD domain-containing protein [Bacteroidales bacterium]
MPKFLCKASYTSEGARGVMKEGGTARRAAVEKLIASAGGKLEAFYFAYGETDVYLLAELPDTTASVALSLAVNATAAVRLSMTPLITPEEFDAATKKALTYRPPGA